MVVRTPGNPGKSGIRLKFGISPGKSGKNGIRIKKKEIHLEFENFSMNIYFANI